MQPQPSFGAVEILFGDCPDLSAEFQKRVKAVGGRWGRERSAGPGPKRCYAEVPARETALLDALVSAAAERQSTEVALILRGIDGVPMADQVLERRHTLFYWSHRAGASPSEFLARRFAAEISSIDWAAWGLDGGNPRQELHDSIENAVVGAVLDALEARGDRPTAEDVMAARLHGRGLAASVVDLRFPGPRGAESRRAGLRHQFERAFGSQAAEGLSQDWLPAEQGQTRRR